MCWFSGFHKRNAQGFGFLESHKSTYKMHHFLFVLPFHLRDMASNIWAKAIVMNNKIFFKTKQDKRICKKELNEDDQAGCICRELDCY